MSLNRKSTNKKKEEPLTPEKPKPVIPDSKPKEKPKTDFPSTEPKPEIGWLKKIIHLIMKVMPKQKVK